MSTPTGEQYPLAFEGGGRQSRAIITEVAAGLRAFEVDGVALVETYAETSVPPYGSGIVLVPWPNRVEDGEWMLDGETQHLDISEPKKHNAIHGLLRYTAYRVTARDDASITLTAMVFPQHGYPFQLDTAVRYELGIDGLTVTHTVTNAGEDTAPVAIGAHPYLRLGDEPLEQLTLSVGAATHIDVDGRLNPTGETDVTGTVFDLRGGVLVNDLTLDDGFGGVPTGATHRLSHDDGRFVELWRDDAFSYVQVFTNTLYPKNGDIGLALAVEPMTAPAGAFRSGDGLRWLAMGETMSVSWGIRYSG